MTLDLQTMSSYFMGNNFCPAYKTKLGGMFVGDSIELLKELDDNSVNLVITSPPFALQRKKEYGNLDQHEYIDWFLEFAKLVHKKLKDDGSFVVDFGGSYMKGVPARSLYNFRVLIRMVDEIGFFLAEDFYWFNPSKLPSPIEWVNKRKLRVKDSVNTVWWFSKTEWPKSDVTKVLAPYSDRMKKLIEDPSKFYTPKMRPSGHDIGSSFGKDNGGAIPPNLLQISNSESNGGYLSGCKKVGIKAHPARFPAKLPEFFIKMLTEPNDLVVDIFGGSNTTGQVAESLGRRWITFEQRVDYVASSVFRFIEKGASEEVFNSLYNRILEGEDVEIKADNHEIVFD
ncbi:TPA: site-specific DNA-methyltransferase [Salmonella enterica]|uniref:DNA-methyltransferase n=7 Tax=Enterobacteriaceae TaxID=543 RepID=UPI000FBD9A19|nr:site-specific DNA-methyltransferase [Escherichia coli]EBQ9171282.1 site-specific DNA-methyltransferase [Salmonella enterica subsp. enterica serovar Kentucky]ECZ9886267.1 site-specific DNA-methyltransferase [Salmonella enterica subsp. enterica serovar Derby]EDL2189705.1 site-specific DNA-methyltransferase [Salmonella enterica subsp. enterica serovar Typhimurium]EHI7858085.1 site-specific DNA-methyltransferase [Salmonella enterica]ECG6289743.1 site-specific DNA-methyltransferase [Salmonella e